MPTNPLDRLDRGQRQIASIAAALCLAIIVLAAITYSGGSPPPRSLVTDGPIPTLAPTTVGRRPVPASPTTMGTAAPASTAAPRPTIARGGTSVPVTVARPSRPSPTASTPSGGSKSPAAGLVLTSTTDVPAIPGE